MANSLANGMSNYLDTLNWHNNQIPLISDTDAIFINKNNVKQAILKQLVSGTHFINSIKKDFEYGNNKFSMYWPRCYYSYICKGYSG